MTTTTTDLLALVERYLLAYASIDRMALADVFEENDRLRTAQILRVVREDAPLPKGGMKEHKSVREELLALAAAKKAAKEEGKCREQEEYNLLCRMADTLAANLQHLDGIPVEVRGFAPGKVAIRNKHELATIQGSSYMRVELCVLQDRSFELYLVETEGYYRRVHEEDELVVVPATLAEIVADAEERVRAIVRAAD